MQEKKQCSGKSEIFSPPPADDKRDKRSVQDLQENSVSVMHSKPACILSSLEDAMVTVGLSSAGNDC